MFAANDDMAIGLIRALLEAGRRVPEDISVVGFDDIPVAAYVTPPLTTVRQPFDEIARHGLKRLVHAIENPDVETSRRPTHRSSSSSAPRRHPRRTGPPCIRGRPRPTGRPLPPDGPGPPADLGLTRHPPGTTFPDHDRRPAHPQRATLIRLPPRTRP